MKLNIYKVTDYYFNKDLWLYHKLVHNTEIPLVNLINQLNIHSR